MSRASTWLVLAAFLAIAGFFLLTEHRAHAWGLAPWLLVLACPLLHFFMHRGHGGHGGHGLDAHEERESRRRVGAEDSPAGRGEPRA